ncbi:AAA domain-containing protein [Aliarcobacter cryaerophilus]|uniref:AAA domain-containing protein n=1 Tax=Aliarcobacter cryaerophilus TaxID=28198 RepID=UPI000825F6A3|nr:AAA domain-containing protein [Aliarcobacter cryaerophilus]
MKKKEFLDNLFKYYNQQLLIDNVIGVQIEQKYFREYFFEDIKQKIIKQYNEKLKQSYYFSLSADIKKDVLPITPLSQFEQFVEFISFYEKSISLENTKLNKKIDVLELEKNLGFKFSEEGNAFQYGLAFNLLPENPLSNYSKQIPTFVILFPDYDKKFNIISIPSIFAKIKQYLELELTKEEQEIMPDCDPILVFNPKVLEPYNLDVPEFDISDFQTTQNNISYYMDELLKNCDSFKNFNDDYQLEPYLIGISKNLNMGLTKIYTSIFKYENINNTLQEYFTIHERKANKLNIPNIDINEIITSKKTVDSYKKHLGSFDKEYPLAKTQREAFTCYQENKKILPVNGAPGTGKTSLLRAIFGDYTVKAAMSCFNKYEENGIIEFSTPIVCSSTNNQALANISEGINDGFTSTMKKEADILYTRWLANDIEAYENKIINFNKDLFSPSIKSKAEKEYELSKYNIESVIGKIAKDPMFYLQNYFSFRGVEIEYNKVDKNTHKYLKEAAKYFYDLLMNNKNTIETRFDSKAMNSLEKLEIEIVKKYIEDGVQEDLIKAILNEIKSNYSHFEDMIDKLKQLKQILNYFETKKKEVLQNLETKNIEYTSLIKKIHNNSEEIKTLETKIEKETIFYENTYRSPFYFSIFEEEKRLQQNILYQEIDYIKQTYRIKIESERKNSSFLEKAIAKVFQNGILYKTIALLQEECSQNISIKIDDFYKSDSFKNSVNEKIKNKHQSKITHLKSKINEQGSFITDNLTITDQLELEQDLLKKEYESIQKKYFLLDKQIDEQYNLLGEEVISIEDIEKFLTVQKLYKELDYYKKQSENFDTQEKTDNFYFALHLLEAMFFIKNKQSWNGSIESQSYENKTTICPICQEGTMVLRNDRITCNSCKKFYSFNNPNNPKELNKNQLLYVMKYKKAIINDKTYKVISNDQFINIITDTNQSSSVITGFDNAFPIFPIINITCNSFGTIVSGQGCDKVEKDIFDLMLIDEAGTIPASKMIILNCAKRVILFGDEKQLKPVLPYNSKIESRILRDFMIKQGDIEKTSNYFSCASKEKDEIVIQKNNNAMAISNSCCNYFLPYNNSKMEGDIWLKEHFRCQTPIVNISNEISYHNEILPLKQANKVQYSDILVFKEHKEEKSFNNTNNGEAKKIIEYIQENKAYYIRFLQIIKEKDGVVPEVTDEDYYNSIGIITPFVNQEYLLRDMVINEIGCSHKNKKEPIIKVGTVHKYQGSEREIIIFSSVYNIESSGKAQNLFFNREDPDMINVAVTRAKEVFVLFGNRNVLIDQETYSGIMLKHIDKYKIGGL